MTEKKLTPAMTELLQAVCNSWKAVFVLVGTDKESIEVQDEVYRQYENAVIKKWTSPPKLIELEWGTTVFFITVDDRSLVERFHGWAADYLFVSPFNGYLERIGRLLPIALPKVVVIGGLTKE